MNDNHTTAVIMESLTRILENARFASSPQMSAFLRYVVDEAVAGNADRIKAYSVAVDALGKPESFDAQKDPCVRVLAMRLRESLADYYREHKEPVVITIPRGSYKPKFTFLADNVTPMPGAGGSIQKTASIAPDTASAETLATTVGTAQMLGAQTSSATADSERIESDADPTLVRSSTSIFGFMPFAASRWHRWALASVAVILGIWVVQSTRDRPSSDATSFTSAAIAAHDLQLAAAGQAEVSSLRGNMLRPRPRLPTVHIWVSADNEELISQIGIAVSSVLARFKSLVVVRHHAGISQVDAWPEDYQLKGTAVSVDDAIRVNAELTHVLTGAIAYTASFEVAERDGGVFSPQIIEMIEAFSAQLARYDGPLISDYRQRDGIRPELACLYDLQRQHDHDSDTGVDDDQVQDGGTETSTTREVRCGTIPSLQDHTRISSIMLQVNLELDAADRSATAEQRAVLLGGANALAEQAVMHGPFRADTHAILMKTLRLTGDVERAMLHGARAMELNRFDSQFLRQYAQLLAEVNETEQAEDVRAMADKLDPMG